MSVMVALWNCPMAILLWKAFSALVAGHGVVLKPATEVSIPHIDWPMIGAEVHSPFVGVKETGNGHREFSYTVLDIFMEWKSVQFGYSKRPQRAQIEES